MTPPAVGPSRLVLLVAAAIGAAAATAGVQLDRVGPRETAMFRAVNRLPDQLLRPLWLVMQLGSFAGVPISAAAALLAGRPRLAARLAVAGSVAYVLPKPWKRAVGRGRPSVLLADVNRRDNSVGLGFPSGHTAVATALALTAAPSLPKGSQVALAPLVGLVAGGRMYVGAHLPLDLVGGAAMGALVAIVVELGWGQAEQVRGTAHSG